MLRYKILIFLIFGFVNAVRKDCNTSKENNDIRDVLSYAIPEKLIMNLVGSDSYNDAKAKFNITCMRDLAVLRIAFMRQEVWALKMLDAASKIPSGILEGNTVDLGMYDECISIENESLRHTIQGRHCMYSVGIAISNFTLPISPTLSMCVPSSCEAGQVADILNRTIKTIVKVENLKINILSAACSPIEQEVWDLGFIICTCILLILISFLTICTLCGLWNNYVNSRDSKNSILESFARFSLIKSASSILSLKISKDTLTVIHGIRFLSIAWVVLGHEYMKQITSVTVNRLDIVNWIQSWSSLYVFLALFSVDTFFTLSGFLMTYLFFKQMPKQKSFNVPLYYLHRYFRLTPTLIALLAFGRFYIKKMSSGALWEQKLAPLNQCNWWIDLLYLQNFVDKKKMCFGHIWYLAVDMQLFWISPIILYPLYKKPKIGLTILATLFLTTLIALALNPSGTELSTIVSMIHGDKSGGEKDIFRNVYIVSYYRAGPWLIGIFLGYVIGKHNQKTSKMTVIAGWLLTILCFAFCTIGMRSFLDPTYVYHPVWETFFATFSRSVWSIGVCWIIYACIQGYAGPISTFLSWKIFFPLSRLSYCTYLLHFLVQTIQDASQRIPIYFSVYNTWRSFLSTLAITIVAAFFFSLLFESPILILEKIILKRQYESQSKSKDVGEDGDRKSDDNES